MPETDIAKQLGATIAEKRKKMGLTQAQLAEKLDIGQDALSRMEQGKISPKLGRLPDIAKVLECSVADLFRYQDEDNEELATQIADMIKPLAAEQQRAVLELLPHVTKAIANS